MKAGQRKKGCSAYAMAPIDADIVLQIARNEGTPFYAYHWPTIKQKCRSLQGALGQGVRILYSAKANPHPRIIKSISGWVAGVEVASGGELQLARSCDVDPKRIVFTGPGKTDEELAMAACEGLLAVSIESMGQAERLNRMCDAGGHRQDIILRANPIHGIAGARISMGGRPSQFGIDEEKIEDALRWCGQLKNLRAIGLHVYAGTGVLDAHAIGDYFRRITAWSAELSERHHFCMVNVGGGFGVPYYPGEEPLNLKVLTEAFGDVAETAYAAGIQVYAESGRYLVAESGCYVTGVVDVKESRGTCFVVVDGGTNHLLGVGGFGRMVRRNPSIRRIGSACGAKTKPLTVVGPLCTPADRLADEMELPADLTVGDLLVIDNVGAYGRSGSPLNFLSHDWPAEYLVSAHMPYERISSRVSAKDIWNLQDR